MDPDKIAYFVERYRGMDGDALVELHSRRESLADEALAALDTVFSERGINRDVLDRYTHESSVSEQTSERELAHELYKSRLAMSSKVVFMMAAWSPVQYVLAQAGVQFGALWAGVTTVLLAYLGYRFGNSVTRSICARTESTVTQKKRSLRVLLFVSLVVYFLLFLVAGALFSARGR